jgi:hypothetical protein
MVQGVAAIGVLLGAIGVFAAGVAYISQTVFRERLSNHRRETAGLLGLWTVSLLLIFVSGVVARPANTGTTEQRYIEALALAATLLTLQYLSASITFEWRFDQWSNAVRSTLRRIVVLSGILTGLGAVLVINPPVTDRVGSAELYGITAICASFLVSILAAFRYAPPEVGTQDSPAPPDSPVEQRETVVSESPDDDDEPFAGTAFEPAPSSERPDGGDSKASGADNADE